MSNKIIQKLKSLYFFVSIMLGILVVLFSVFDFLLFAFYFHFSFATYKDFYLDSFDVGMSSLLILFALVPIIFVLLFFLVPGFIVKFVKWGVDELKLEKSILTEKDVKSQILFIIYFCISYLLIGLITFSLLNTNVNLLLVVIAYVGLLTASFFYSVITFKKELFSLICFGLIIAIIILLVTYEVYKIILLVLLLFIFFPMIMMMFLILMQGTEQKTAWLDFIRRPIGILILFVGLTGTIYLFSEINKDTWTDDNITKSDINNFSLNLMLNKIFLTINHKLLDVDVSNYYGYDKECINNTILFNEDSNVTVLSLSRENKLYFKKIKKYKSCIYAIKVLNVKGKDVYKLVDVGYIENIKER